VSSGDPLPIPPASWPFVTRVLFRATILFVLFNLTFAFTRPLEPLGRFSLYNTLLPGRLRLPYGEEPAASYNLSLDNIPAMFASHAISRPKAPAELRILLLGDSGTWGWLLANEDTLAGQLNRLELATSAGRRLTFYNLGYPVMSLAKDLLLLEEGVRHEPDLVIWLVTLQSFPWSTQLDHPLLQANPARVRQLIDRFDLALDPADPRFVEPAWPGRTIVGQRRALGDLLRLQLLAVPWAITGIDQAFPDTITLRSSDFEADVSWQSYEQPQPLDSSELAADIITAGIGLSGEVPVLVVNEPIYISTGQNSDLRYNAFYPRWAYDEYRRFLADVAERQGWHYLDLWNTVDPDEFTDTPVHLSPDGVAQTVEPIRQAIMPLINR
jgi:hypothetical protein